MENPVFVVGSHDYSDEFDVDGCMVLPRAKYEEMMAVIGTAFEKELLTENSEFYFGTNEALIFYSFDDFANGFTVQPCSEAFATEFRQLNKGNVVGNDTLNQVYTRAREMLKED